MMHIHRKLVLIDIGIVKHLFLLADNYNLSAEIMNEHDKMMVDLQRLIGSKDFKSEKELALFLDGLIGQKIPEMDVNTMSKSELAQQLVFEAARLKPAKAKKKIEEALVLDPNCIEAYEYLASLETSLHIAFVLIEKGVNIGRIQFGGDYLKKNKGHFWGFVETRAYMRCLEMYGMMNVSKGNFEEAINVFCEMIELNSGDNQGVRNVLLPLLIEFGYDNKYATIAAKFKDDSAPCMLYNNALYSFKTEGKSVRSNKLIKKAIKENKHIAELLLSDNPFMELPAEIILGGPEEAAYYSSFALGAWAAVADSFDWLEDILEGK